MPTVIESLVVSLGLDPKKFGSGVAEASKNLSAFDNMVRRLGINEANLDDKQKLVLKTMREMAAQTNRTGKELHAATSINADFWKIAEKGALGFGSALAAIAIGDFTRDTMAGVAAQGRLAATLGMTTQGLGALGDAIEASVGGSAESARGALAAMNKELQSVRISGQSPENLMAISSILSRYNGGQITPILDPQGRAMPLLSILEGWADSAKKLGPQQAQGALGGKLPPDLINFLLLGRSGMEAAIGKAAENQPDDATAKNFQAVETAATEAEQSLRKMAIAAVSAFSPELILGLKNLTAYLEWAARGFTDSGKRDEEIRANDAEAWGPDWLAKQDAERAWGLMKHTDFAEPPAEQQPMWRRALGALGIHWGDNNHDAAIPRLAQRIRAGATLQQAAADEEAGLPLPALPPDTPTAAPAPGIFGDLEQQYGLPPGTLGQIQGIESGGKLGLTSPAGAQGPFQIMPDTARQYGLTDPNDRPKAAAVAARYLSDLRRQFGGDMEKAEAAYNWGPGNLSRDIAANGDRWRDHLPLETQNYIRRLTANDPRLPYRARDAATGGGGTTTVNTGDIHVHTRATDAHGIAKDIHGAMVAQAATGAN